MLEKSILCFFRNPQVLRPNQTARGMMLQIDILVEHCCGSIANRLRDRSVWPKIGDSAMNAELLPIL